jgi:hypothetical protein
MIGPLRWARISAWGAKDPNTMKVTVARGR